jgi:circadian clock protein KaiC
MKSIAKSKTGINGLDEITAGGLPTGRPTLLCGGPGCGKTLLAIEFIVRGATLYNEPGVFMTFEEKTEELTDNVASLGFDLNKLVKAKKIRLDYVHIDRSEIEETGEYDLNGLFIRLEHAINSIGAKRVVLDTIENLFAGLTNEGILRAELRRLFHWLKDKGVTAIITGEKGDGTLTRHSLEEYVSDCVILLDHRIVNQVSTRRMRIIKYRGSVHGTNEYPFLIDEEGITIFPVTSLKLDKDVSTERIPTGFSSLDKMFDGKGFFRGSSVLVSGTSGTGKTSIAAYFTDATCKRKERCLFIALEESPKQIIRNMKSIGIDLDRHVKSGLLQFQSFRPGLQGLEMHLASVYKMVRKFKPQSVVLDPITNLVAVGLLIEVNAMLLRLIDFMQSEGITLMLTALNSGATEHIDENVSSLVDVWISVRDIESDGERNRAIYIMKSRGMQHSNEVREFLITSKGLDLVDVFRGPNGVLVGSARKAKMKEDMASAKKNQTKHLIKSAKKISK